MMREEPISLVAYDDAWPRRFQDERAELARVLAPWLVGPIEHIGSTAIPRLLAKPVIDIMAGVADLPSSVPARAAAATLGYVYSPYRADVMHWFCKPSPAHRTHHLHLVPTGSALWADRIAFRDYLRSEPGAAAEYAALKTRLAAQYRFDREAYTDGKSAFVAVVLERARDERMTFGYGGLGGPGRRSPSHSRLHAARARAGALHAARCARRDAGVRGLGAHRCVHNECLLLSTADRSVATLACPLCC